MRCTTVNSNMASRLAGIPWNELPNLFQHALDFTHKLDVEYLWIDSLCIIQDDETDWNLESTKMAGIYENAKLTLAASCAINSDGEIFFTSNEQRTDIKVKGLEHFGVTDDVYVRIKPPHVVESFPLL